MRRARSLPTARETLLPRWPTNSIARGAWPSAGRVLVLVLGFMFLQPWLQAAKIGQVTESKWWEQALRFGSLADPAVRYALVGAVLLGLACGLLGGFLVVRQMALVGDALSHAVLPGVALGFLWNASKDPWAIFVGATLAGLMGTFTVRAITRTTRIKEDTALGMVLAGFFSAGMCLVTRIQKLPMGNQGGITTFLFGQAAALKSADLILMALVCALVTVVVVVAYKELLLVSFDPIFSQVCGLPARWLDRLLMLLLAFTVVIALQAVGVVLVSAMLITPAATASLLTDRFHRLLIWSALIGIGAGAAGAFLSFLGSNLPTGPLMVLVAGSCFAAAFLFAPRRGVALRWWRDRSQSRRIARENTLKAVYHIVEDLEFRTETVSWLELAGRRRITLEQAESEARALAGHQLATLSKEDASLSLTPAGWQRACEIVRNHRLWELYLTQAAQVPPDHVHDDAEKIEHVLGADAVRELERRLRFAKHDPHGRPIPTFEDLQRGSANAARSGKVAGYGG